MENKNSVRTNEEMLLSMIRTGSNLCGYHIPLRRGIFPPDYAKRYNMPEQVDEVVKMAVVIGLIAPQSTQDWFAMFADIENGSPCGSSKIFMRHTDGQYVRYWMRYTTFPDDEGKPLISLITFDNISAEYEESRLQSHNINALLQIAQRSFTGILSFNLTKHTCRVLSYDNGFPTESTVDHEPDVSIEKYLSRVHPQDREPLRRMFSYENLCKVFLEDGRESLDATYRHYEANGSLSWLRTTVTRQNNDMDDDVLLVFASTNIDAQKAQEIRLTEELWLLSEEIRVTTGKLSRRIFYYDIPSKTLTVPPDYSEKHGMEHKISNYPDSISLGFRTSLPDTYNTIHRFYEAIQRGEPSGSCEMAFNPKGGTASWHRWEYATIFDQAGKPARAVIFVEDITDRHLMDSELKRLRSNEHFSRIIAQHSDRTVYFYEVEKARLRPWEDIAAGRKATDDGSTPSQTLTAIEKITPDDTSLLEELFSDIRSGVPQGDLKLHAQAADGTPRWFDIRFSTIFGESNTPTSAVISLEDTTEQYESELNYLRHLQAMRNSENHLGLVEVDLHTGIIETQSGRLLPSEVVAVGKTMASVADYMLSLRMVNENECRDAKTFFTTGFLTEQYSLGIRRLERTWKMIFHSSSHGWIHVEADLVLDPYSQHKKAFFRLTDVTKEKNAELEMLQLAERDGMTRLFNRATTESRIQETLARGGRPGILLLLDLDDLKGINDTFGHNEGDRAIRSIAETLRLHFREGDIIGRVGGDEFLIYLPGAGDNPDAISASVSNLLRKLTRIPIGEDNQRRIHCSIGCAVQLSGDSFEQLYKRADVALYSIKRSGKNNYAFYTSAMEESNHSYQAQRLLSQRTSKKVNLTELQYLLTALTDLYEAVVAFNLTTRDYFLMEEDKEGAFAALPSYGTMDDFINMTRMGIHPDDVSAFMDWLAGDALMQAYERGERSVRYYCRFFYNGAFQWVEVAIVFYVNEDGDLCDFTLLRWAGERTQELDQLSVSKALELAVNSTFEYACLVDVTNGQYTRYGKNTLGNHNSQKSYDEAIRQRQTQIEDPEQRAAYYTNACLATVMEQLAATGHTYSFRYTLSGEEFQASFEWVDPEHTKLFLTVQKCS